MFTNEDTIMNDQQLLLSDCHGIYIPKKFVESFDMDLWHISEENAEICKNPDHEFYWESWEEILDSAYFIHNGKKYMLYQDGDLWTYY